MSEPVDAEGPTAEEVWALNNPVPGSGDPGTPENPYPPPPEVDDGPEGTPL